MNSTLWILQENEHFLKFFWPKMSNFFFFMGSAFEDVTVERNEAYTSFQQIQQLPYSVWVYLVEELIWGALIWIWQLVSWGRRSPNWIEKKRDANQKGNVSIVIKIYEPRIMNLTLEGLYIIFAIYVQSNEIHNVVALIKFY